MSRTALLVFIFLPVVGLYAPIVGASQHSRTGDDIRELIVPLAGRAPTWRCEPTAKFQCSIKGCEPITPTVWVNLDFPARRYERCDSKGCDAYQMEYFSAGIFTMISPLRTSGTFLKAVNDGREFVEVASLTTSVYTSFGQCTPRP